jgi:hypothetical protein
MHGMHVEKKLTQFENILNFVDLFQVKFRLADINASTNAIPQGKALTFPGRFKCRSKEGRKNSSPHFDCAARHLPS